MASGKDQGWNFTTFFAMTAVASHEICFAARVVMGTPHLTAQQNNALGEKPREAQSWRGADFEPRLVVHFHPKAPHGLCTAAGL